MMRITLLYIFFLIVESVFGQSPTGASSAISQHSVEFIKNQGQVVDMDQQARPDIMYITDGGGVKTYLQKTRISYVYTQPVQPLKKDVPGGQTKEAELIRGVRFDVNFKGANPDPVITEELPSEHYYNFYLSHCPKGITNVKAYNKITYGNMYKNTDVIFYGGKKGLKYDIVVKPGGNLNDVQLSYAGVERMKGSNNRLLLTTGLGEIEEYIPKIYQNIQGKIVDVEGGYVIKGQTISFQVKHYNPQYSLVIDPWVSYYGYANCYPTIASDPSGNVLLAYAASSIAFPVTPGVAFTTGGFGPAVLKLNPAGSIVWWTYYGTGSDAVVACDKLGNVLLTGNTSSNTFPVTGAAYQSTFGGGSDAFIVKLNSAGQQVWSTYYGGATSEEGNAIRADNAGNIFIGGTTFAGTTPVTMGPAYAGASEMFFVKFDAAGNRQWARFFGGSGNDFPTDLCVDNAGNMLSIGFTVSNNIPVTSGGAFGGGFDAVAVKLDPSGNQLWAYYYGGSGFDYGFGICTDNSGNIIISGYSASTNLPTTAGVFQQSFNGGSDAYIFKLNSAGTIIWGTYYGGATMGSGPGAAGSFEENSGLAVDSNDDIFISGDTYSSDLPTTSCAYQPSYSYEEDNYVAHFDKNGQLICATYIGGPNTQDDESGGGSYGSALALTSGAVYMAAYSNGNYPLTANAYSTDLAPWGGGNAVVSSLCKLVCNVAISGTITFPQPASACVNTPQNFTGSYASTCPSTPTYSWVFNGGTPATSTAQNPVGISFSTAGTHKVMLIVDNSCSKDTLERDIVINPCGCTMSVAANLSTDNTCNGSNNGTANAIITGGTGPYTYSWSNGTTGVTTVTTIPATGLGAITYTVSITDGVCTSTSTVSVTEPPAIVINSISSTNTTCGLNNGTATVTASGGLAPFTYLWSAGGQTAATATGLAAGASYTVQVSDATKCSKTSSVPVSSTSPPSINATIASAITCSGGTGSVSATAVNGTSPYTYSWSNGTSSTTSALTSQISNLTSQIYTVTITDANLCTATSTIDLTQPPALNVPTLTPTNATCGFSNGSVIATTSGGTGALTYSWNNSANGQTISGLAATSYTVTVKDGNACSKTGTVTIANSSGPAATASITSPILCNGGTGSVSTTATAGPSPYTYNWSNGSSSSTTALTSQISNLTSQIYTVTITDANLCTATSTINLPQPPALNALAFSPTDASCGNSNGSATVTTSGGVGSLTYSWNNSAAGQTATALAAASYTVTVTDGNGCSKTGTVTINNSNGPSATGSIVSAISCNGGTGSVSTTATGGSSPYSYNWSNGSSSATTAPTSQISNLTSQIYTVTITDANLCTATTTINLIEPNALNAITLNPTEASCGNNNGSITASTSGGTGTLTYSWNNSALGQTTTGLAPASYTVTVKDANGCSKTASVTLTNLSGPSSTASIVSPIACNGGTGSVSTTATGGSSPFTYNWSNGSSAATTSPTSQISNLTSQIYTVTITDSNLCTSTSTVDLTQPSAISVPVVTPSNSTCGKNNGSAFVSASGGTGALTYAWSTTATGQTVNALLAGPYVVTVADANGCTQSASTTVVDQGSPSVSSINTVDLKCNGDGNGMASINLSGGTAPYTYTWTTALKDSIGSNALSIVNLSGGAYMLTVTDANNCTATSTFALVEPSALTVNAPTVTNASCGSSNGSAFSSASGGTGTLTYSWSSNGVIGQTANNLAAASYTLSVTDGNGCSKTVTANVSNVGGGLTSVSLQNTIACAGMATGSAVATIVGGTPSYTYVWSNGMTGPTATGLLANGYTVTVTDANGCLSISSLTVTEPAAISAFTTVVPSACGLSNGSASVAAAGGSGGLAYMWSEGSTTSTASNLSAQIYVVTVTDGNNCTKTASATINNNPSPTINSLIPTNVSCNGSATGAAIVNASGGSGTLTYSWSNLISGQTGITGLTAANYAVSVTDASGCIAISSVSITEPPVIAQPSFTVTDAACAQNNGSIVVTTTGGTGAITYNWSTSATGQTAGNLAAGPYKVTLVDGNNCSITATANVNNNGGPTITAINATNPKCFGNNTGTASVTLTAGNPPYTYSWSDGTSGVTSNTNSQISNLTSQIYSVTVTDVNGCKSSTSISLTEPTAIQSSTTPIAAACGLSNGSASVSVNGGTSGYSYQWSTGVTTQTASGLPAKIYTVTVTDGNGCTNTTTATINNSPSPTINSLVPTNVLCNGGNTGAVNVSASGGTGPLTYNWSNAVSGQTGITGLTSGTYAISVTDGAGCIAISTVSITEAPPFGTATFSITNAACGLSNGVAVATITGGSGPITYVWSSTATGQTANNLSAGPYNVTMTDGNNCSTTATTNVNNNGGPTITAMTATSPMCFGSSTGSASVTVAAGNPPYTYSWSNSTSSVTANTNSQLSNLTSQIYSVTITDANNCKSVSSINMTQPPAITTPALTPTNSSCGQNNGAATALATGGTGTLTYTWSSGASGQTANNLSANTNYTVTVTDQNNCLMTNTISLVNNGGPSASAAIANAIKCYGGTGTVSATASGGIGPYTFNWSTGVTAISTITSSSTTVQLANLIAQNYSLTITDVNGCSSTSGIVLTQPAPVTITSTTSSATCGDSNGSLKLNLSGGSLSNTYSWAATGGLTGIMAGTSATVANLLEGIYTVTVTDNNGCTLVKIDTVKKTIVGIINITPAEQTIYEGASVALSVTGGTTYTWMPITGLSCTDCPNPTVTPTNTTTYTITATDTKGCAITAMITITVKPPCIGNEEDVFIPNIFSPNGDGKNDILYVSGNGLINMYWSIYDRWGNLLFESYSQALGWNGAKDGNAMETGTYVYYLKATCIKTNTEIKLKGNVSLVK